MDPIRIAQVAATALVDHDVVFEGDAVVWNWVRIRAGTVIGADVSLGDHAHVGPRVRIGAETRVGNGVQIHEPAVVGERVFIGPNAFLGNDKYPQVGMDWNWQPVVVGDDVVIGACAAIMGGVTIGKGAVVGMGAVVIEDVPEGAIACGNPAKIKAYRSKCFLGEERFEHWGPVECGGECPICNEWRRNPASRPGGAAKALPGEDQQI